MRIVTWNMNYRDRVRQHGEAWAFLRETLQPDIALLQEVVIPEGLDNDYCCLFTPRWADTVWGSAILSRVGDLERDWEDNSRGAALGATSAIPGLGAVSLACLQIATDGGVIVPLRRKIGILRKHLGDRFVLGGDFNTARQAHQAWPSMGHGEFWGEIETWGFHEPLPLGGREQQSYWGRWLRNELPSLGNTLQDDHVLLDGETFALVEDCQVWDTKRVRDLSDHGPVVVDLTLPT